MEHLSKKNQNEALDNKINVVVARSGSRNGVSGSKTDREPTARVETSMRWNSKSRRETRNASRSSNVRVDRVVRIGFIRTCLRATPCWRKSE